MIQIRIYIIDTNRIDTYNPSVSPAAVFWREAYPDVASKLHLSNTHSHHSKDPLRLEYIPIVHQVDMRCPEAGIGFR
jgi:hypothetical protein